MKSFSPYRQRNSAENYQAWETKLEEYRQKILDEISEGDARIAKVEKENEAKKKKFQEDMDIFGEISSWLRFLAASLWRLRIKGQKKPPP